MTFREWLETATKSDGLPLSSKSVYRYANGFKTVSELMLKNGVITKPLEDMNLIELDLAISVIFNNSEFLKKDSKGNKMYSNALKRYRCYKRLYTDLGILEAQEEETVKNDPNLNDTDRETIIKARRGQGIFRNLIMNKYNKACIITNVSISQVLVASHIKPWAVCNNHERLDVNNGLLLSATYDRLFDSGLITFDTNGKIKISSMISKNNAKILNLSNGIRYDIKYDPNMMEYIKYHNEYVFVN